MRDNMKKNKILYVDTCHDVAGGQRSLIALLTNLKDKLDYSILIDKSNEKYEYELLKAGVPASRIMKINSKPLDQRWLGGLSVFFKALSLATKNPIVHCNTFYDGLFAMPAFRLFGKKTVFRARCGIDLSNHGVIDKIVYWSASVVLANSEYVKNTFGRISKDLSKVNTLYNPLDMKFAVKKEDVESFQKEDKYVIAVIGAITEVKRQKEVLEAFSRIDSQDVILRFIGEPRSTGKDREYYNQLLAMVVNKKLQDRVVFTGFVSDVRDKLKDVDLICVPSDREPLGRVIFESQLYTIPVLASRSGGNTELIEDGETGYLYELGCIDELAKKLLVVKLDNTAIANNAKKFVLERFSPERTYLAELDVYNTLTS
ncbi:N-acetyl-alpha-D-glucosaminyl L-malate synthase [Rahnella aquatilis]|nr:N-acetyl-alpha-D-glucosaminyl L-malate synthase [Rahnella aquatilis]